MLYFVLNYFAFLIANTLIEITILRKLHQELKEKRRKMEEMNANRRSISSTQIKKLEEDDKKEKRAITMVVLNSVLNLSLRFPDFIFFVTASQQTLTDNFLITFFCYYLAVCNEITDVAYFSYILTFSTNCIMYYFFNNKFKQAFRFWKKVKK